MLPLVPTAVIFAGVTNHIGLAIPKPFQTVWEKVTTKERSAYAVVEGSLWSKVGLLATKVNSFALNFVGSSLKYFESQDFCMVMHLMRNRAHNAT